MDSKELNEFLDQQRWLLNNGLITDSVKNQLFFCGSVIHPDVQAVELSVEPENKKINYVVFFTKKTINKIEKYKKLSMSSSLFGMWRFKRFLKKEGALDFQNMLDKFVKDFCGPKWSTLVTISDFDEYVDSAGDSNEVDGSSQQFNK